jgi:hypothetical protein
VRPGQLRRANSDEDDDRDHDHDGHRESDR